MAPPQNQPEEQPSQNVAPAQIQPGDQPLDRLMKVVPAEFAGTFLALSSFMEPANEPVKSEVLIGAGILMLVVLPIYLWKVRGITSFLQHIASWLALLIWGINISPSILGSYSWYSPYYGGAAVILWAIIAPIFTAPATNTP